MQAFFESVVTLIVKTSTDLPPDVRAAMKHALDTEEESSRAGQALNIIAQNIDQATEIESAISRTPACRPLRSRRLLARARSR